MKQYTLYTVIVAIMGLAGCEAAPATKLPPVADAGPDQVIDATSNISTTFDGRASFDLDGQIVTYSWSVAGVPGIAFGPMVAVDRLPAGDYVATLVVTDDSGNTATDTVNVKRIGPETGTWFFSIDTPTTYAHLSFDVQFSSGQYLIYGPQINQPYPCAGQYGMFTGTAQSPQCDGEPIIDGQAFRCVEYPNGPEFRVEFKTDLNDSNNPRLHLANVFCHWQNCTEEPRSTMSFEFSGVVEH